MYAFCQQAICRHRALVTYFWPELRARQLWRVRRLVPAETVAGEDTERGDQKVLAAVAELRPLRRCPRGRGVLAGASTADP